VGGLCEDEPPRTAFPKPCYDAGVALTVDARVVDDDYEFEPMSSNGSLFAAPRSTPSSRVTVLWDFSQFSSWHPIDVQSFHMALVDQLLRDDPFLHRSGISTTVFGTNYELAIDVLRQLSIRVMFLSSSAHEADLRAVEQTTSEIQKTSAQTTTEVVIISSKNAKFAWKRGLEDRGMKVLLLDDAMLQGDTRRTMSDDVTPTTSVNTSTKSQRDLAADAYALEGDYEPMSHNRGSLSVPTAQQHSSKVTVLWDFLQFSSWNSNDVHNFFINLVNRLTRDDPSLPQCNVSATAVATDYKLTADVLRQLDVRVSFVSSVGNADVRALEHAASDICKNPFQTTTEVVVITSRNELSELMRTLERRGMKVLLVHNAMPSGDDAKALEMHPSQVMHLSEMLPYRVVDAIVADL
jgi:hypothetical protein